MSTKSQGVCAPWLNTIPFMQQSVLLSGIRGMDGMRKLHPAKALIRFYRRVVLVSAFEGKVIDNPWDQGGGDFTGPSIKREEYIGGFLYGYSVGGETTSVNKDPWALMTGPVLDDFIRARDEMPLHFFSHMMHAFEIVGYKHPNMDIRILFYTAYIRMVHALHLWPETVEQMDARLGDNEAGWRSREDAAGSCST